MNDKEERIFKCFYKFKDTFRVNPFIESISIETYHHTNKTISSSYRFCISVCQNDFNIIRIEVDAKYVFAENILALEISHRKAYDEKIPESLDEIYLKKNIDIIDDLSFEQKIIDVFKELIIHVEKITL